MQRRLLLLDAIAAATHHRASPRGSLLTYYAPVNAASGAYGNYDLAKHEAIQENGRALLLDAIAAATHHRARPLLLPAASPCKRLSQP